MTNPEKTGTPSKAATAADIDDASSQEARDLFQDALDKAIASFQQTTDELSASGPSEDAVNKAIVSNRQTNKEFSAALARYLATDSSEEEAIKRALDETMQRRISSAVEKRRAQGGQDMSVSDGFRSCVEARDIEGARADQLDEQMLSEILGGALGVGHPKLAKLADALRARKTPK